MLGAARPATPSETAATFKAMTGSPELSTPADFICPITQEPDMRHIYSLMVSILNHRCKNCSKMFNDMLLSFCFVLLKKSNPTYLLKKTHAGHPKYSFVCLLFLVNNICFDMLLNAPPAFSIPLTTQIAPIWSFWGTFFRYLYRLQSPIRSH